MARVESSGVAKAGLTTGIIGTSLAGLLSLRNGNVLGGLLGNGRTDDMMQSAALGVISELQGKLAQSNAERYADNVGAQVFDRAIQLSNRNDEKINTNLKEALNELVVTRERLARNDALHECQEATISRMSSGLEAVQREVADIRVREQATNDAINCLAKTTDQRFDAVYHTIDCCKKEVGAAIALESERRICGDNSLMQYVNATFVPGRLVMPRDSICPEVMQRWNAWMPPTDMVQSAQPTGGSNPTA